MYQRIELPDDAATFWDIIHRFTRERLSLLERVPYSNELVSRLAHAWVSDRALAARLQEVLIQAMRVWVSLWTRGQELGVVRSDLTAQTLVAIGQSMKEALVRAWLSNGRVLTTVEFERLTDVLLDLLRRISAPPQEQST